MSLWSRIANVFRGNRLNRDIEEELQSHIAAAITEGRDPGEARRAFGSVLSHREKSRDIRLIPWLESLYADAVFGWRQLLKRKVTSAAAILSLALAIGPCAAAFRSGYSAHPLAGIVVCRCSFRMAATPEEKGDVGCRHPFARSRHWALRRGIPRHGRYAVAAVTGCRSGAALCSVQGSHRPGRQGHDI